MKVIVKPWIGFWQLLPPTHLSTLFRRTLRFFLAGTERLEKKRRIFSDVDFEDVMHGRRNFKETNP
jgi:hypothetical protein